MHPIFFRIPLPGGVLSLPIILLIVAGLAAAFAIRAYIVERRSHQPDYLPAIIAAAIAAISLGARFFYLPSRADHGVFQVASIPIFAYGVMLGLSLVVGWYITLTLAERDGLPKETMANCYVVTALAAIVGARVLYVVTNPKDFEDLSNLVAFRSGGLVAYGGFLGGYVGSYLFLKRHKISILPWADVAVPSLASGLFITRIGCYLFGCDFGRPLSATAPGWLKTLGTFKQWPAGTLADGMGGPPALTQHRNAHLVPDDAVASLPVHPTQIYESLVGLAILVFLLYMRRHQKFRGQIFLLFFFTYGVCRYLLEILRDDLERGSIPPALPEHLLIPLGLVLFAIGWCIGFSKMIANPSVRRATQFLSFLPAIVAYLVMHPESYAFTATVQYSTSQFVALSTGVGSAIAFSVLWRAAIAHPESAMSLNLPVPEPVQAPIVDDDEEDEDEEEEEKPKKAVKKAPETAKKAEATSTSTSASTSDDATGDEGETEPAKEEAPVAKEQPAPQKKTVRKKKGRAR